jgi:hypothetical protein
VQFRHPYELGGMYWMFGFVLTMGSLPVAIILAEMGNVAEEGLKLAWKVVGTLIPCTVVLFAVFFLSVERKYWGTFYSIQKGKELTMKGFKEGNGDEVKAAHMAMSKHHWISIEHEVKAWVEANWERWEDEKPNWFDDAMRARIPVEYIPEAGDARRRESVRRASVDAEAEGGIAGAVRASIRRASVGGADGGDIIAIGNRKAKVSSVVPRDDDAFKRQQIIEKFEEIAIEGAPGIESHFEEIYGAQEISSAFSGQTLIKAEKGMGWGKTSITVRASHKDVAAFFWELKSRVDPQLELHRVNNKTLVITVKHKGHFTAVGFSEAGQMKTEVEMVTRHQSLGKAASKKSVIKHLSMATDAAYYFDNLLKSTEAEKEDGRRFGEQLMARVKKRNVGDSKVEVVREFIVANRTLREITEQHGFMRTMLYAVVMNKFKRRATNEGEAKSEEEARG